MPFSRSRSTSNTTNDTQNAGASDLSDNATVVQLKGAGNNVTVTDKDAIARSFEFAERSQFNALDLTRDLVKDSGKTVNRAISSVTESAREDTENVLIQLQKFAIYGGLIWGAVQVVRAFKG